MIANSRHAGRTQVLMVYEKWIEQNLNLSTDKFNIAVVGGVRNEPELEIFDQLQLKVNVEFFGVVDGDIFLDLNETNGLLNNFKLKFDLVICCQVLEHIWNMNSAVENLATLSKKGGLIWINVPASNLKHGSPDFFSAGYQPNLFAQLFGLKGFNTIIKGDLGSKRLYFMTHLQQFWPSHLEHKYPFLRGISSRPYLFPAKFLKNLKFNIQAMFWSPKIQHKSQYSTETYYLCQKMN
jgi:SAM-dependent methyltransferase